MSLADATPQDVINFLRQQYQINGITMTSHEFHNHPDKPTYLSRVDRMFGTYRGAVRAAGLPPRPTRRPGDQAKIKSIEEVDAQLATEFVDWDPGNFTAKYRARIDWAPGLPVASTTEQVTDVEIYDAQGQRLVPPAVEFNPAQHPGPFTVHLRSEQINRIR